MWLYCDYNFYLKACYAGWIAICEVYKQLWVIFSFELYIILQNCILFYQGRLTLYGGTCFLNTKLMDLFITWQFIYYKCVTKTWKLEITELNNYAYSNKKEKKTVSAKLRSKMAVDSILSSIPCRRKWQRPKNITIYFL